MKKSILLIIYFLFCFALYAQNRKVALVIGNSQYSGCFNLLCTPQKDAEDVSNSLKRLGYDVITATNVKRDSLDRYLNDFKEKSSGAEMALFYYSGHGFRNNENELFLVPSGNFGSPDRIEENSSSYKSLMKVIQKITAPIKLIFIDACQKSISNTMGAVARRGTTLNNDNKDRAEGTIQFFAAGVGQTANIGNEHSLFTQAFLNHIADQNTLDKVWMEICKDVLKMNDQQQPYYIAKDKNLIEKIKLNPYKTAINPNYIERGKERVTFYSSPSNATIEISLVDKKDRAKSYEKNTISYKGIATLNNGQNILLEFGKQYQYSASAPGYETNSNTFTFSPEITKRTIVLTKLEKARLEVSGNVTNAIVTLDGERINKPTPFIIETTSGVHQLSIAKNRYLTHNATIKLSGGDNEYIFTLSRDYPWFWDWDDDAANFINYHYGSQTPLGVSYLYRPDCCRFSFGAIVGVTTGLFRGWSVSETNVSQNINIGLTGTGNTIIYGINEHYSPFIDPYNEAKHYDATALILANIGFSPCNGIMVEAGLGASHHRDLYYMNHTYEIIKTNQKDTESSYMYKQKTSSHWYKENSKWSPAMRIGTRLFIPMNSHLLLSVGGGYTHLTNNNNYSSCDANIGICWYL